MEDNAMTTPATPTPPPGSPEAVALRALLERTLPYFEQLVAGRGINFNPFDALKLYGDIRAALGGPLHGRGAPDADAQGDER